MAPHVSKTVSGEKLTWDTKYNIKTNCQDNLTAILYKTDDIRLEQQDIVEPAPDQVFGQPCIFFLHLELKGLHCATFFSAILQVLLKMDSVGICGSDVHYWTHGAIGDFIVKYKNSKLLALT